MYIPLISHFPAATPGPHKTTGYAYARAPCEPFVEEWPKILDRPALSSSESLFTIFYPSTGDVGHGVSWLPDPLHSMVAGYNKFLGGKGSWMMPASRFIARRFKMTVAQNGPVEPGQYPLIIFSHGLAGTRNTYSQVCSALASEGYVVLAVEHKDGTGPCVTVPEGDSTAAEGRREFAEEPVMLFTRSTDLTWAGAKKELMDFRVLQLRMRVHEVQQAFATFRNILAGNVVPDGKSPEQAAAFAATLRESVDMSSVILAGHSFGGATILRAYDSMPVPVTHLLALDPWFEPLVRGEETDGFAWPTPPPTLVINSQGFTEWKEVWPAEKRICATLGATLVTIGGLAHQGFSDFPLITTWPSRAFATFALIHRLCMAALRGQLPGLLREIGKREEFNDGILNGAPGEVIVHDTPTHELAVHDPTPPSPEQRLKRTLSHQEHKGEEPSVVLDD